MQLVIDTANTTISVKNKCFYIRNKSIKRQISPKRISSIAITTNCIINSSAIKLAAINEVPILFFNNFGTIQARLCSPYFVNLAELRKKQLIFVETVDATKWIIDLMKIKSDSQINNLVRFSSDEPDIKDEINDIIGHIKEISTEIDKLANSKIDEIRNELMGYEGSISRYYFRGLNMFMPTDFKFESRNRRPALDYFNSALNYLYGMTYSVVESGVFAKGLDPFIGILHVDNYNNPTLVYDIIEPIRPIIDKILISVIKENRLSSDCFVKKSQGYWINKKGKRIIIPTFNEFLNTRIKFNEKVKSLKEHIYRLSNDLGNYIEENINLA